MWYNVFMKKAYFTSLSVKADDCGLIARDVEIQHVETMRGTRKDEQKVKVSFEIGALSCTDCELGPLKELQSMQGNAIDYSPSEKLQNVMPLMQDQIAREFGCNKQLQE